MNFGLHICSIAEKTSKALLWAKEQVLDAIGVLKASRDYTQRPYSKDIRKVAKRVELYSDPFQRRKRKIVMAKMLLLVMVVVVVVVLLVVVVVLILK